MLQNLSVSNDTRLSGTSDRSILLSDRSLATIKLWLYSPFRIPFENNAMTNGAAMA
jgi:hypothetical protein